MARSRTSSSLRPAGRETCVRPRQCMSGKSAAGQHGHDAHRSLGEAALCKDCVLETVETVCPKKQCAICGRADHDQLMKALKEVNEFAEIDDFGEAVNLIRRNIQQRQIIEQ